jgi:hypothetical protein
MTKYGFDFDASVLSANKKRLINQFWKLIPMKENNEDWESQCNTLIEEIAGLSNIYKDKLDYLVLLSKLEGLTADVCEDFMLYRKTVFRCIDLLCKVM